jgi:hypothetical protein
MRVCIFVDGENLRHTINDLFTPAFTDAIKTGSGRAFAASGGKSWHGKAILGAKMPQTIRSNHYRQLAIELRKLAHQARFPSARKVLIYTA